MSVTNVNEKIIDICLESHSLPYMQIARARKPRRQNKRDQQRKATNAALMEAGRKLFGEYGYEGVSVTDIGKAAGVSHSMINAYFDGKAGLLYAIVTASNEPQYDAARKAAVGGGTILERVMKVLSAWARADLSDPRLLAVMQAYSWTWSPETETDNLRQRDEHMDVLRDLLAEGATSRELPKRLDAEAAVQALFAIYTWGLRPAIFEGVTPATCIKRIKPQVEIVLSSC